MARHVPAGTPSIVPHLSVPDASEAIEFYKRAFGAEEMARLPSPDGERVLLAELRFGDARVYVSDAPARPTKRSRTGARESSVTVRFWTPDCDRAIARAVAEGARVVTTATDAFWGDRWGVVRDPFGHDWALATHTKDLTPEEFVARAGEHFGAAEPGRSRPRRSKPRKTARR